MLWNKDFLKSDLTLSYQKEGRKHLKEMVQNFLNVLGFLFNLSPVHVRRGLDFLFKTTESPFNPKFNAQQIFKNPNNHCCNLV